MKNYYTLTVLFLGLFVNAQIVTITDTNFKNQLLAADTSNNIATGIDGLSIKIDTNNNNEIEVAEALQVSELYVYNSNIANLTGIVAFSNLTVLECWGNQLTNLNLSGLSNLEYLDCRESQISDLNLTGLTSLRAIECGVNQLTSLNLAGLDLEGLVCEVNQIQSLDLSQQTNLQVLQCDSNQLTTLDLSGLKQIYYLICNSNLFTTLDVSNMPLLDTFVFNSNPNLTTVNLKNGSIETFVEFDDNPSLVGLCADAGQITQIQDLVTLYNLSNCSVSSDCALNTNNFANSDSFKIYPNPVNSILNFEFSNDVKIYSITVYNILGQLILKSLNAYENLDVSSLKTGNYWIKINTDQGITNAKFIKL